MLFRSLNDILIRLRDADVQVNYMYSLVIQDSDKPLLVLATDQMAEARKALGL